MPQLTKGMYGTEFDQTSSLFGLRCGQMSSGQSKITHNSGWYNKRGEKLGWGDLSLGDFQRIADEIEEDELFIILNEQNSYWNFFKKKLPEDAPGVEYVATHSRFIIAAGQLYGVGSFVDRNAEGYYGLPYKMIEKEEVLRKMIPAISPPFPLIFR